MNKFGPSNYNTTGSADGFYTIETRCNKVVVFSILWHCGFIMILLSALMEYREPYYSFFL